uniref:Putative RNA binding protein n=1 Tax=Trypanosoma congolense (strain IL3000) TaxID=1068625 RepID=G0UYW5_TRYCI|nr:putative RNA binding protein [Trypanosoma congolense IL3000]
MNYTSNAYYGQQPADAYYDQQAAGGYHYGEGQQVDDGYTIDLRPPDITEQQDNIIQLVAKYVVDSCDGARYQHKLIKKTKFNSYFAFLASPEHKYHEYYQYLIRSYTHWRYVAAASAASQSNEGYAFYTEQLQQQQQMYSANMYHASSYGSSVPEYTGPSVTVGVGATAGGYYDANSAHLLHDPRLQPEQPSTSVLGHSTAEGRTVQDEAGPKKRGRSVTPQDSSEEEEEDQEMEFVMENGVARAVLRGG